jgi:NADPH-dependent glutamate synthase beta subunit-like oxidoreductase
MPLSVAVVGAGPAGFYAVDAVLSFFPDAQISIIDQWPTPFGLVRFGVAPDHLNTKNVTKIFEKTLSKDGVSFAGNVMVGTDVSYQELRSIFDLVILSMGMGSARSLCIPGVDTQGVISVTDFVDWYNAVPRLYDCGKLICRAKAAVVIGNGNVALDIARLLAKTESELAKTDIDPHAGNCLAMSKIQDIYVIGRRGPVEASFSFPELSELGDLERAEPVVDKGLFPADTERVAESMRKKKERNLRILESFSQRQTGGKSIRVHLLFCASPLEIVGEKQVIGVNMMQNEIIGGQAKPTGKKFYIETNIVCPAIGYDSQPIDGVPYDKNTGQVVSDNGRVEDGVCVIGWAHRGPIGVIGSNRVDAREVIGLMAPQSVENGKPGLREFHRLLASRKIDVVDTVQWRAIDLAEKSKADGGRPRVKFNSVREMLAL